MSSPIPFLDALGQARISLGKVVTVKPFKGLVPDKPVALQELLVNSGVGVVDFANTLQILEQNGFVRHYGTGSDELVELTKEGAKMLGAGE